MVYDANDRLLSQGGTTFTYDDDGNTLAKQSPTGTTTYAYDDENRVIGVTSPTTSASFVYDADGNRVQATENGTTTNYLVDTNRSYAQVLEETDGANNLRTQYTWGNGLIRQDRAGVASFYHADGHGSIRALTDINGNVTDTYTYDAYGGLFNLTGTTPNNYRYAGEQFDEALGMINLRSRFYNPSIGRFHTMDSFGGFPRSPLSLNKYLYANGNPVMGVDPSGLFTLQDMSSAMGALGNLARMAIPNLTRLATTQLLKTAATSVVSGAVQGAISGGLFQLAAGGDVGSGILWGAGFGAVLGPIVGFSPQAAKLLLVVGTGLGSYSATTDFMHGEYRRGIVTTLSLGIGFYAATRLLAAEAAAESGAAEGVAAGGAATPIGRRGNPMNVSRGTNAPTTIGGRDFTGHAIDQMQGRGMMPSVVNDTIRTGVESAGRDGARIFTTDQLKVILNPSGSVKTVIPQ